MSTRIGGEEKGRYMFIPLADECGVCKENCEIFWETCHTWAP